ncbi:MAG: hypothetical protein MK209_00785 [Planctomycetes bacterium]|nr:hypothetical protein [Planctomycetota bacterium]
MSRREAHFLKLAQLLVAGTGLVWAWMLYFVRPTDDFSILNHPWQDEMQAGHVLTAPLLIFAVAAIWKRHAWQRIRSGFQARRMTGIALAISFFPMAASAYLLQVSSDEGWREIWKFTHLATSVAWILLFLVHLTRPRTQSAK